MEHVQLAADGIISQVTSLGIQIEGLLVGVGMGVICLSFVVFTFAQSRSVPKALVAFIGSAAFWYLVMNMTTFRDKAGVDLKGAGAPAAVVQFDPGERDL